MSIYMAILYIGREREQGTKTREFNEPYIQYMGGCVRECYEQERLSKQI